MKKPLKINQKQLRNLINEAIQSIPFGQAAETLEKLYGTPEITQPQIDEKFGPYDASDRYDSGFEPEENSMYPHNWEQTHKVIFEEALEPVIKEFTKGLMEMHEAGFAPEGREGARRQVEFAAQEMKVELMDVIEKWLNEGLDRIV